MGLESTIIACIDAPTLLRPGALSRAAIEQILPLDPSSRAAGEEDEVPLAPGQLASHYAPRARLRLNAERVHAGEALLAFGPAQISGAERAVLKLNLSPGADLIEAAANLFSHLRALDACGASSIVVMPVPEVGLGEAINDRLRLGRRAEIAEIIACCALASLERRVDLSHQTEEIETFVMSKTDHPEGFEICARPSREQRTPNLWSDRRGTGGRWKA